MHALQLDMLDSVQGLGISDGKTELHTRHLAANSSIDRRAQPQIAVGFGSSFQLLSRGFSFRHDDGEGGRWKRVKEGEGRRRSGKTRVTDQSTGMTERASMLSGICLPDPQGRDEAVAQEGVQNSPFWDP
jgi:hypothetical protein